MFQAALILLVLGILCLAMTLCDEGLAWWRYCRYRGKTTAVVVDRVKFTFEMSRSMVLAREEDGTFTPIPSTADRSAGQMPYAYWLFQRDKDQLIVQWEAEGRQWKGHYRYLKKDNGWQIGERIPLRYRPGKPWCYGIRDEGLWRLFLAKCLGETTMIFLGIILMMAAV